MKKYINIFIVCCMVYAAGCDVLNQDPESVIAESNFYQIGADAEAAALGIYAAFRGQVANPNTYLQPGMVASDEADAFNGGNNLSFERFEVTPTTIPGLWNNLYTTIGRANDVLFNVPGITNSISEETRNRVMGEAYFFRGYCHFLLLLQYGKVPIITSPFLGLTEDYRPARDEISEVYQQIIDDLTDAKQLLSVGVTDKSFLSKWAAAGILAKVYLSRNNQGDMDSALAELNEIISSDEYSLVPSASYSTLFSPGAQNTLETIWEVSLEPEEPAGLDNVFVPNGEFNVEPSIKIINAYKEDSAIVVANGLEEVRMEAAIEFHTLSRGSNQYFVDKYTKDDWTLVTRAQVTPNVIILRLADVLLLKAEILNEKGETPEAIDILNTIRNRVNLPNTTATTQAEVREAIERERFLELAFEGHRYFDLVRKDQLENVLAEEGRLAELSVPIPEPEKYIWPVPQSEIDQNPNLLPQNPGY